MNIYSLSRKYVKLDIPKETINTNKKHTKKKHRNPYGAHVTPLTLLESCLEMEILKAYVL